MRNTLIAASALALLAGSANAASVSYTASVDGTAIVGSTSTGTIELPDFDGSLGTLVGVTLTLFGSWSDRFAAVAETAEGDVSASDDFVTVTISNLFAIPGPTVADVTGTAGSAFSESVTFGPSGGYSQDVAGLLGAGPISITPVAPYIGDGTGTVSWFFDGSAVQSSTADTGVLTGLVDFSYDLDATITYDYLPETIPVPAALPLLAAAFGVMGFVRARRA